MKSLIVNFVCAAILQLAGWGVLCAQEIHMSYPGLTGESAPFVGCPGSGIFEGIWNCAKLV
jgi:hypothetical protein